MPSNVISSGKAVLIGSFVSKGISIVSSVILARLLFEKDYGAMILSAIFGGLITQIGGMGYELYYLQHKGNEAERRKVLEQVYNLRLVTNIIMFTVQGLIGLFLFAFTDNKMSGGILMLMAVSLVVEGFNAPQETLLKDKMEFRKITIGNIFKEVFAAAGKVTAAFLGFGGYAFGVGPILGSFVRLIYLRKVQPYKHEYFNWDKLKIKEIFNFGKHVLFGSAAMYLVQQVDRIFLTIFFPQNIVGRYGFAWGNAAMPYNYLIMPQQQLIMTYVTRFKSGKPELFYKLNIIKRSISLIIFPILALSIIYTEQIIILLFSTKWIETVILIKLILVYYSTLSIIYPFTSILTGLGKPDIVSKITLIKGILLIVFLFFVGFYFSENIIIYVSTFCIVSFFLDAIKAFLGIKLTGVKSKDIFESFKIEFVMIFFILLIFVITFYLKNTNYYILIFILFLITYTFLFFLIENENTLYAIKIYMKKYL